MWEKLVDYDWSRKKIFQLSKCLQSPTGTIPLNLDVFNYLHNNLITTYSRFGSLCIWGGLWWSETCKLFDISCPANFLGGMFSSFLKSISEKENYQKFAIFWIKKKILKICHNFLQCKRVLKIFVLSSFEYHQICQNTVMDENHLSNITMLKLKTLILPQLERVNGMKETKVFQAVTQLTYIFVYKRHFNLKL